MRHQREGKLPRQPHPHAGIGQRFHDEELIARSAAAERGDGVEMNFVHWNAPAHRFEDRLRALQVGLAGIAPAADHGHPLAHHRRRVGHGADHRILGAEQRLQPVRADAGHDRDQ